MNGRRPDLIGVIDLKGGVAVRAIAGRRDEYRPVVSRLGDSPDPLRVAAAFRDRYGIDRLYVADLDAITGAGSNATVVAALAGEDFEIAVDPGVRSAEDAKPLIDLGIAAVVAGLETLPGPPVLEQLVSLCGPDRIVFSLDLAGGTPLGEPHRWGEVRDAADSPLNTAKRAAEAGATRFILLDLHAVGTSVGPATADLCRRVRQALPHVHVWTGGGVRTEADVKTLLAAGAEGVLVASALHDGTL